MSKNTENAISNELLEILACPVCKSSLTICSTDKNNTGLKCSDCSRIYPVRNKIPIMLESEAILGDKTQENTK